MSQPLLRRAVTRPTDVAKTRIAMNRVREIAAGIDDVIASFDTEGLYKAMDGMALLRHAFLNAFAKGLQIDSRPRYHREQGAIFAKLMDQFELGLDEAPGTAEAWIETMVDEFPASEGAGPEHPALTLAHTYDCIHATDYAICVAGWLVEAANLIATVNQPLSARSEQILAQFALGLCRPFPPDEIHQATAQSAATSAL